jgi:hypothetical protein
MKYNQITVYLTGKGGYWYQTFDDSKAVRLMPVAADSLHEAIENTISMLELNISATDFVLYPDGRAIWKAPTSELKSIVESIEASIANIARLEATIQEINTEMAEILDLMKGMRK